MSVKSLKSVLTEIEQSVVDLWRMSDAGNDLLIGTVLAMREYGLENQVKDYLDNNPDASYEALDAFVMSLFPDDEIVDDDELDDDD